MEKNIDILGNIVNFLVVSIIFLVVLGITFKITLKNYNVKTSKIKFYGLFLGMNNRSILSFSMVTLNYIFLIWWITTFSGVNLYFILISVFLMMTSDILLKDYKRMPVDLLFCIINILCIFVTELLYKYLTNTYKTVFLLIVLGLVIIFVFLYYTYITFKLFNNIVLKQENLDNKKYKKL